MEKARLEITKTKKGEFMAALIFENNKKQPLSDFRPKDDSLNGKEVMVERQKGQVVKIICEGKEIYSKSSQGKNRPQQHAQKHSQNFLDDKKSIAPYNFIPLNENVVFAEQIPDFDFDKYHQNRYTGYIDLEIKALTPLYIRDTLTDEEYKKKIELESKNKGEDKKQYINPDFFSPGGLIRIPGSSLRGMIRTMVEIVSYGKFGFFEGDRKFHFRSFADNSLDLRDQYREKILGGDKTKGYYPKVKAGYLVKEGLDYHIIPAKVISGNQFFRVEEKDAITSGVVSEEMKKFSHYSCKDSKHNVKSKTPDKCPKCNIPLVPIYEPNEKYKLGFKLVKFKYESPKTHTNHSVPLYYAKVTGIWNVDDPSAPRDALTGTIVFTNWMRGPRGKEGKHLHWVIGPEDNSRKLELAKGVLENYKNDKWREEDTNLLRYFENKNSKTKVPCFYVERNGQVISFGHTGLFRLAYEKSLKEFLTDELRNATGIDITEAIFGKETEYATRVFFEDAYLAEGQKDILMETAIPKILSNPKPTTFQHYLEQDEKNITYNDKGNVQGLKTYNDDTRLRGYKLYWHREADDWEETNKENIEKHKSQYTQITPVKKGTTFKSRIRFENLSSIELGALLFALDLPEDCAYKLGMGKPLGLGSVKIKPTLYLSNRTNRYQNLFFEWYGIQQADTKKISELKQDFEKYVLEKIKMQFLPTLWEVDRIKELKRMLDYEGKPYNEKTRYLRIEPNEFRARRVLPKPTEVK